MAPRITSRVLESKKSMNAAATNIANTGKVIVIGGGAAGLGAAWTLKQRGVDVVLLEADARAGGRLGGDRVDGFSLDQGADFFCSSYDVALRMCKELQIPLLHSDMNLGWYRNGRWVRSSPPLHAISNLPKLWRLGLLSPGFIRLVRDVKAQSEHLNFASDNRIVELEDEENFGDFLQNAGVSEALRITLRGFLEMTMGHIETSSAAYMKVYLAEMLLKADQIQVPEKGLGALMHALVDACGDVVRLSTPVRKVVIRDGRATGVLTDEGHLDADAVICAIPATKVAGVVPDLPLWGRQALDKVTYSCGVRLVIGLDHPPLPAGWHGALYPEDDTPLLLDRSINLPACVPPGKSTLDLLVGRDRARALLPMDDAEIKRQLLRDARRNPPPGARLPGDNEGLFSRVYRWEEAVCMAQPGMFRAMAALRGRLKQDLKNLFLAGDYMCVPSVNGALASGVDAATACEESLVARKAPALVKAA